jgi:hypothetical protein
VSIWIRRITGDRADNFLKLGDDLWDLPSLFTLFESWLIENSETLDQGEGWIADIGFNPREGACGGGPIISIPVMEKCLKLKMSIFLSEYDNRE